MTGDWQDPAEVWKNFRAALLSVLADTDPSEIERVWANRGERTDFYTSILLRDLATRLGLELEIERFAIDFALVRAVEPAPLRVPVVLIESENEVWEATDEVEKLARLAAPLRALFTVAEWSDHWPHGGHEARHLARWQPAINACGKAYPRAGLFSIIVGEQRPDATFEFYTVLFDGSGRLIERSTPLGLSAT